MLLRQVHNGYFVDLFVRKSNQVAIGMYEKFGYTKYREVSAKSMQGERYHTPLVNGPSKGAGLLQWR